MVTKQCFSAEDFSTEFESCVVLDGNQTDANRITSLTLFESCVVLDGNQT